MTDYTYAVIGDDGVVTNIIAADNPNSEVPLRLLIPDAVDIVLVTEATGPAYINGDRVGARFRSPSPYPSWIWNSESWSWKSPVPYPDDDNGYIWDERTVSWIPFTFNTNTVEE